MPAVKTRVLTAGLYFKKNELRLEISRILIFDDPTEQEDWQRPNGE
jgi:hypothetical protein